MTNEYYLPNRKEIVSREKIFSDIFKFQLELKENVPNVYKSLKNMTQIEHKEKITAQTVILLITYSMILYYRSTMK